MTTFQKALLALIAGIALLAFAFALLAPARYQSAGALVGGASTQALPIVGGQPTPGIVTVGEGNVKVKPDVAQLSIGVTQQAGTAAEAQTLVADRVARVLERAKALGIADADTKNAGYTINPQYGQPRGPGGPPVIVGYQATQTISLTYRKVNEVGKALDALVQNDGATNVSIRLTLDDAKPSQAEARKLAIAEARSKAQAMADAAGVRLGKPISVNDLTAGGVPAPQPFFGAAGPAGSAATSIPTGDLDVTVRVQVQFAID